MGVPMEDTNMSRAMRHDSRFKRHHSFSPDLDCDCLICLDQEKARNLSKLHIVFIEWITTVHQKHSDTSYTILPLIHNYVKDQLCLSGTTSTSGLLKRAPPETAEIWSTVG
ncbi:hypothetical protein J6590_077376 [Homalodisca vitripennis]|nr:hypothetical protein J6590_077376 [Homalodisca vitripennis]